MKRFAFVNRRETMLPDRRPILSDAGDLAAYEQGDEPVIPSHRHRKYQHRHIASKQRWAPRASSPSSSNGDASQRQTSRQLSRLRQIVPHGVV